MGRFSRADGGLPLFLCPDEVPVHFFNLGSQIAQGSGEGHLQSAGRRDREVGRRLAEVEEEEVTAWAEK
jgi:hypothetical protein